MALPLLVVLTWSAESDPVLAVDRSVATPLLARDVWYPANGLPIESITSAVQTRDGYLWLGTAEGVYRFDGVRFSRVPVVARFVTVLLEDRSGGVWILTEGSGLLRWDAARQAADSVRLAPAEVRASALCQDSDGSVLIGTVNGSLWRYSNGNLVVAMQPEALRGEVIRAMRRDRHGTLWVGTYSGAWAFTPHGATHYSGREGLHSALVSAIHEDRDGHLWVGTDGGGLSRFENGNFVRCPLGPRTELVRGLLEDDQGNLWIATWGGGLWRYVDGRYTGYGPELGLPSEYVSCLWEDHERGLWIGTERGLCRLRDAPFRTFTARAGLPHRTVRSVFEDRKGRLWVGTGGGGVASLEQDRLQTVTGAGDAPPTIVLAIAEGRGGEMWFGTFGGGVSLLRHGVFRNITTKEGLSSDFVWSIAVDREGTVWIGTYWGLNKLQDGKPSVYPLREQGIPSDVIRALLVDRSGRLWVGTSEAGLAFLAPGPGARLTAIRGLEHGRINGLCEGRDGVLWAATDAGLCRVENGEAACVTAVHGLPTELIEQVIDDGLGDLWLGTPHGIIRLAEGEVAAVVGGRAPGVAVVVFDEADGLETRTGLAGSPAACRGQNGRLWFATLDGLATIRPGEARPQPPPPPISIVEVTINGHVTPPGEAVVSPSGKGSVDVRFTAPTFEAPERVRFRWKLSGFDREWSPPDSRREARYTNLPPGRYEFAVTARNASGVWNHVGASVVITLEPGWWQTRTFKLGVVVGIVAVAFGLYRLRVRHLTARARELERKVAEALGQVKVLRGLLPICASCKKIRDDQGGWNQIEAYIHRRSEATFSHSICPDCARKLYPELYKDQGASEPPGAVLT